MAPGASPGSGSYGYQPPVAPPPDSYAPGTGYYPTPGYYPPAGYPVPGAGYPTGAPPTYPPPGAYGQPPAASAQPGSTTAQPAGASGSNTQKPASQPSTATSKPPSAPAQPGKPGTATGVLPAPSPAPGSTLPPPSPSPGGLTPSANMKPAAPPSPGPFAKPHGAPQGTAAQGAPVQDSYPQIGEMESITFGTAQPGLPVEQRLSQLENAIFKQAYTDQTLFDRTERLKQTLLGGGVEQQPRADDTFSTTSEPTPPPQLSYFDEISQRPENQAESSMEDLAQFAIDLINYERQKYGLDIMSKDALASKLATEHIHDLMERRVVSHQNQKGDNPDQRYTQAGGLDAISESLVSLKTADIGSEKLNRAAVAQIIKVMMNRQDDREALLSPDAGNIGFAIERSKSRDRITACTDVITKHGIMSPLPLDVHVGDKLEIKGVILSPYKFERVTVAWEGLHDGPEPVDEDNDEALPYFPPLDYVAYCTKAERDHSKAIGTLKMVGIVAAIAGGVFMPPVALAAPLIAMSGPSSEPKPMSDIPVHGGVKVEGSTFTAKVPISNSGKEGLYYITVWASSATSQKPIPISRRAIVVTNSSPASSASPASDTAKPYDDINKGQSQETKSDDSKTDDDRKNSDSDKGKSGKKKHKSEKNKSDKDKDDKDKSDKDDNNKDNAGL